MQNTNVISMEGFNLSEEVMEQCNAFIEKHTANKRADASFSRQIKAWINHAHRTKQTPAVTVPITSADDGLKWRFRALYPEGAASRGACVSYMGTNHTY